MNSIIYILNYNSIKHTILSTRQLNSIYLESTYPGKRLLIMFESDLLMKEYLSMYIFEKKISIFLRNLLFDLEDINK